MKRAILVLLSVLLLGGAVFSTDLLPVGRDLESFLQRLGEESLPFVQQNAMAGEGLGIAQFSDDTGWYLSITPMAFTLTPGLFDFITEGETFELLNVDGLVGEGVGEFEDLIGGYFFFSLLRLNLGFALPEHFELSFIFSIIPPFFTEAVAGIIGVEGISFSSWTAGVRLRKPLISDEGGFPAISIGVGYSISTYSLTFDLPEAFEQDISGTPLTLTGDLSASTWLHTFGVDFILSKKLGIFVPFLKLSPYYQIASFNGSVDNFEARTTLPGDQYTLQGGEDPSADVSISDLNLITTGGFELLFGKFALVFAGHYGIATGSLGADLSMRMGF